ncbi:MAG: PKD domain-containing protein [Bacteroidia bacterium]
MKSLFSLFCLFALVVVGYSQTEFQKFFGGSQEEYGYRVVETADGGYAVCGRTFSFGTGGWEGYVLKLNAIGDTVWTKTYGNTQYDEIQDINPTTDGGFILTGHTWTTDFAGDLYLIKLSANGLVQWDYTYGGSTGDADKGYSVIQTIDGGYVVCGSTETFGAGGSDIYVIKTNSSGDINWTRTVGTAGAQEVARCVRQTSDGGYVLSGYTDGGGAGLLDAYLIRLNSSGDVLWTKTYGGGGSDFAYTVEETSDAGFILGATTNSFGAGGWDGYLLKTNSTGALQWSKTLGLSGEDRVQSARQCADGGYILCGRSNSFGFGNLDATIYKTDVAGNLLWTKAYGSSLEDQAWSIHECVNGGFIMCGYTFGFGAGSRELMIVKTDNNGNSGCNEISGALNTQNVATTTSSVGSYSSGGIRNQVSTAIRSTATSVNTECGEVFCSVISAFTYDNTPACAGSNITFLNTSEGASSYQWFINDEPTSNTNNISHLFEVAGTFEVRLIATDASCSDTSSTLVTINPTSLVTQAIWACDSFTWIDGNTYVGSTTSPTVTLTNLYGCDSIIKLELNILQSSTAEINAFGNSFYEAPSGAVYTSSGIYIDTIANSVGCDSIITINLQLNPTGVINADSPYFSIFPNPSEGNIYINFNQNLPGTSYILKIECLTGSEVLSLTVGNENPLEIDTDTWYEKGIYIVRLLDKTGHIIHTSRLVLF